MSVRARGMISVATSGLLLLVADGAGAASSRYPVNNAGKALRAGGEARNLGTPSGGAAAALIRGGYTVNADGRVGAMVELADPSAVEVYLKARQVSANATGSVSASAVAAQATALAQAQIAHLDQVQREMVATLTSAGIAADVIYRVQRVYNGIAVQVDAAQLDEIRAIPGVKAVHPLVPKKPVNITSVPFIGAPPVWGGLGGGATGAGVKVGVIDTGIDYLHFDFGGSGKYRSDGNYVSSSWPKTAKVVGGYDFAGDNYDASGASGSTTPAPDPDPMDCFGTDASGNMIIPHGTHVAGTLAGYGENASGSTFAGPWNASTPISTLGIGPGVAPGAQLYALRIFGCEGSSDLVTQAIDWAVDPNNDGNFADHLDVINMSLGSSYGVPDDPDAVAADRAASLGVIVVAAGGNDNDGYYIASAPGIAGSAIAVAACGDPGVVDSNLHVNSPASIAGVYAAIPADFGGSLPATPVANDLVYAIPANGCSALTNASAVSGKVALIDRGVCNFTVKVKNAQLAGALVAVVTDNQLGTELVIMSGTDSTITIPAVFIDQNDGLTLKANLPSPGVNVSLGGVLADTVASFSSRGPRFGDAALKPDIAAPGLQILSADAGTTNGGLILDGTSMATPHVSGVMALLRQLHPDWSAEELKALVMNTGHDVTLYPNATPPLVGPGRVGGGRVDVAAAAQAPAVAFNADDTGLVSVSFGALEVSDTSTLTKHVTVENKSTALLTYAIGFTPFATVPGVTISFPQGSSVTVPGGGSATLDVQLSAVAAAMRHTIDPSVFTTSEGYPRFWQSEEDGYMTLTPASGIALRVPIYAALRPASTMTSLQGGVGLTGSSGTATVDLTGGGVSTGTSFPTDILSVVSPSELVESNSDPSVSDARFVGVASDYQAQVASGKGLADSTIYFSLALQQPWSNPVPVVYEIRIDANRDGTDDFTLYVDDFDPGDDVFLSILCSLATSNCTANSINGVTPDVLDTAPYSSNVIVLPVSASDLGLKDGNSRFNFYFDRASGPQAHHTFDPAHPGLSFSGTPVLAGLLQPLFPDLPTGSIQVAYSQPDYTTDNAQGVLLLHHLNASGSQAQSLAVEFGSCSVNASPVVPAAAMRGSAISFQANDTASSCSGAAAYDWDFGDGSPHATEANPLHAYGETGTFTWRLVASRGNFSVTKTGSITVNPQVGLARRHLRRG
ncbi:MAG: S8 family serine peptidase [Thermoanaerobaculales bacterium]